MLQTSMSSVCTHKYLSTGNSCSYMGAVTISGGHCDALWWVIIVVKMLTLHMHSLDPMTVQRRAI